MIRRRLRVKLTWVRTIPVRTHDAFRPRAVVDEKTVSRPWGL